MNSKNDKKRGLGSLLNSKIFNTNMVKMKILLLLIILLLLLPITVAAPSYTFKKDSVTDLKISCFDINNDLCNNAVDCYLTVHYPDLTNLISNGSMTYKTNWFNYTLSGLTQTGEYDAIIRCVGNTTGFSTFTFEVTPSGKVQTSILDNPFLLMFGVLALVLIAMGVYFTNSWFGFVGAIMFLLGGVYTMIYGFNNVTDLYTRGIGVTFLGLGFVFMFISAYEWIWGGEKE